MPAESKQLDEYHGEVLTKPWVVDFILDQANYSSGEDLGSIRFVEPAAGTGAFVSPALKRLSESLQSHDRTCGHRKKERHSSGVLVTGWLIASSCTDCRPIAEQELGHQVGPGE